MTSSPSPPEIWDGWPLRTDRRSGPLVPMTDSERGRSIARKRDAGSVEPFSKGTSRVTNGSLLPLSTTLQRPEFTPSGRQAGGCENTVAAGAVGAPDPAPPPWGSGVMTPSLAPAGPPSSQSGLMPWLVHGSQSPALAGVADPSANIPVSAANTRALRMPASPADHKSGGM